MSTFVYCPKNGANPWINQPGEGADPRGFALLFPGHAPGSAHVLWDPEAWCQLTLEGGFRWREEMHTILPAIEPLVPLAWDRQGRIGIVVRRSQAWKVLGILGIGILPKLRQLTRRLLALGLLEMTANGRWQAADRAPAWVDSPWHEGHWRPGRINPWHWPTEALAESGVWDGQHLPSKPYMMVADVSPEGDRGRVTATLVRYNAAPDVPGRAFSAVDRAQYPAIPAGAETPVWQHIGADSLGQGIFPHTLLWQGAPWSDDLEEEA